LWVRMLELNMDALERIRVKGAVMGTCARAQQDCARAHFQKIQIFSLFASKPQFLSQ
jgi:hypothetical protein